MATSSKVKVSTDKLLESVRARRAQIVADHERAARRYNAAVSAYHDKIVGALEAAAAKAADGSYPDHESRYGGKRLIVPVRFDVPSKPTLDTKAIDRLIATLEMAADPTLTISAEDAARYLG